MFVNDMLDRLTQEGTPIFACSFLCRTPRIEAGRITAPVGRLRQMVCRPNVTEYALGVIPPAVRLAQDLQHGLLTVWDVQVFNRLLEQQIGRGTAITQQVLFELGRHAYRRINLLELTERPTILHENTVVPARLRPHWHFLTNEWQVARLAAIGIARDGTRLN